jgi:predicted kinase
MNKTFVVCGNPGSGKSFYGRQLSKDHGAVFLDIDIVTERLVRAGLSLAQQDPDDRDSDGFKETLRQPIYDTLFDISRENLQWNDVVIVGPFTKELRNPE